MVLDAGSESEKSNNTDSYVVTSASTFKVSMFVFFCIPHLILLAITIWMSAFSLDRCHQVCESLWNDLGIFRRGIYYSKYYGRWEGIKKKEKMFAGEKCWSEVGEQSQNAQWIPLVFF